MAYNANFNTPDNTNSDSLYFHEIKSEMYVSFDYGQPFKRLVSLSCRNGVVTYRTSGGRYTLPVWKAVFVYNHAMRMAYAGLAKNG